MITISRARTLILLGLAAIPIDVGAQAGSDYTALGTFLDSLIVAEGVPGAAFAVFDDRGILYRHTSGVKSVTTGDPVDPETTFEAASISKPVFAYIVRSLEIDGVLDLDRPLSDLVSEVPEIAYDPRASALTPRMLLTHQGGLPNWRSRINFDASSYAELFGPDDTLRFVSDPGERYRYSGEGYVLLQRVVEQTVGSDLRSLAAARVFEPLGMERTAFLFEGEVRANTTDGHNAESEPDKWVIGVPLASSTLHTTATDLARFGVHMAGQIRDGGPFADLVTPNVRVASEAERALDWGVGFGVMHDGGRDYVYHGGDNVIFIGDFIYGVSEGRGMALLTNSANGQRVVDAMEERFFGRRVRR